MYLIIYRNFTYSNFDRKNIVIKVTIILRIVLKNLVDHHSTHRSPFNNAKMGVDRDQFQYVL